MRYAIITLSCIIMTFKILQIQGGPLTQLDTLDTLTLRNIIITLFIILILL